MHKNIRLVKADQKGQVDHIRKLYREAFPAAERKPFVLIQCKCREGVTEMLAIEDENGTFLGLAIVMLDRDIALLDYFAIEPGHREGGVGTAAFGLLQKRYEKKRFILEIESTAAGSIEADAAGDRPEGAERKRAVEQMRRLRLRRKSFYLKNGMTQLPFCVNAFGVDMEMLSHHCEIQFSEYRGIYEHLYGRLAGRKIRLAGEQMGKNTCADRKEEPEYTVVKPDESTKHLLNHANQPVDVIGCLIPTYDGAEWKYREEISSEKKEKVYPDDSCDASDYLNDPDKTAFLAMDHEKCVGSIRIGKRWNGNAFIEDIWVDRACRGKGIGAMLMDSAVKWAEEKGLNGISLETQDWNLLACRFYLKYGFKLGCVDTKAYTGAYQGEKLLLFYLLPEDRVDFRPKERN